MLLPPRERQGCGINFFVRIMIVLALSLGLMSFTFLVLYSTFLILHQSFFTPISYCKVHEDEENDYTQYMNSKLEFQNYLNQRNRFKEFKEQRNEFMEFQEQRNEFGDFRIKEEKFQEFVNHETEFQEFLLHENNNDNNNIPQKRFAFALYATNSDYACGTKVVMYHLLKNSNHLNFDIIVYVPDSSMLRYYESFHPKNMNSKYEGKFIVKIMPHVPTPSVGYYKWTFIKTVPMNETEYDKIIVLDADILGPLKDLTHLFLLPENTTLAAPVGYWENELCFTSLLMVFEPNVEVFEVIKGLASSDYNTEMHALNFYFRPKSERYGHYLIRDFILLPIEYSTLTHSVRIRTDNTTNPKYVGGAEEAYKRAFLVHFSEGAKPWMRQETYKYVGDVFNVWRSLAENICQVQ